MKNINKLLLSSLVCSSFLFANNLDIDNLLTDIQTKTDLSEKTKLENGGVSYIYTRSDLDRMQAFTLKDVLKSTYPFGYSENRYGFSDPYAITSNAPFMSSTIRVYIDDQEITNGLYGSGIITYGDIDISFVDHIEVYSGNPTFEYSSESAFTIIKLYSKVAQKDEGSKIGARVGSRGANQQYAYNSAELDNWSYFSYVSNNDMKRKQYQNNTTALSRDKKSVHFFGSFYNKNNKFLIDATKQQRDTFFTASAFGTPKTSDGDIEFIHAGYNGYFNNLYYLVTYDKYNGLIAFRDQNEALIKQLNSSPQNTQKIPYMIHGNFDSQTYTAGIKYKFKSDNNQLLIGSKYRYKHFTADVILNDMPKPSTGHTKQTIASVFAESQHNICDNKIITLGISDMQVNNNASPQDDNLLAYRTGFTYTTEHLISKSIYSHLETTLDPYMVGSNFLADPTQIVPINKQDLFMQDFKYKQETNLYELIGSHIIAINQLMPDPNANGKLRAYDTKLKISSLLLRYTKEYRTYDKLEFDIGKNYVENLPQPIGNLQQYSAILRSMNTVGKFDIFNELLYYRDDESQKDFIDYSAGIKYNKTEDLSFSLKGTNLLDKAKTTEYRFITPTMQQQSLSIAPIDKTIIISVEWTF